MKQDSDMNIRSFRKGLLRGMAGALTLYSSVTVPAPVKVDIRPLRQPVQDITEALRNDWVQTGKDLDVAIETYGTKNRLSAS